MDPAAHSRSTDHGPTRTRSRDAMLAALLVWAGATWTRPASAEHVVVADLEYGQYVDDLGVTQPLLLDLYLPTDVPAPFPVVVWLHGGAWQTGSKATPQAEFLADAGYAVASIDYRLSQIAAWPAQIHDCKGAVRWLRANAATHGLDPHRVGAWGPSAGGHLAACLGTMGGVGEVTIGATVVDLEGDVGGNLEHSSRVSAFVDWFGPTDFLRMDHFPSDKVHDALNSPESKLIGGPIQEHPERCRSANPMTFLSRDDPPGWIAHGTHDPTVPYHQSVLFHRRAVLGFGLDVELTTVLGGAHGGPGFDPAQVEAFFDARLKGLPEVLVGVVALGGQLREDSTGDGVLSITRTGSTDLPLRVRIGVDGSAEVGVDYHAIGSTVTVPAGESSVTIHPQVIDDAWVEGAETLRVTVAQSGDYRVDATRVDATLWLADDEDDGTTPQVQIVAPDPVITEGGAASFFRLRRVGDADQAITARLRIEGDANCGIDVTAIGNEATVPASAPYLDVPVTAIADGRVESTELVMIELLAGEDYKVGADRSVGLRVMDVDRDPTLPLVNIVATEPDVDEGAVNQAFQVSRAGSTAGPLTVRIATGGTATEGEDYPTFTPEVVLPAGETHLLFLGLTLDDALVEGRETLAIDIVDDPGYQIGVSERDVIGIRDDEATSVPSAAFLDVGAARPGRPFELTLDELGADAPYLLYVGTGDGYSPLPGGPPVLLDLQTSFLLLAGVAKEGRVVLAFPSPAAAGSAETPMLFQALAANPATGTVTASDLVRREVLAE